MEIWTLIVIQTKNAALKQSESEKQTSTEILQVSGAKVWFLETCSGSCPDYDYGYDYGCNSCLLSKIDHD